MTPNSERFIICTLVPGQSKVTFSRALHPRACEFPMRRTQVLDLSFSGNLHGLAGLIFSIGLDANRPVRHVQGNVSYLDCIRSRIERSSHALSVPAHDQRN